MLPCSRPSTCSMRVVPRSSREAPTFSVKEAKTAALFSTEDTDRLFASLWEVAAALARAGSSRGSAMDVGGAEADVAGPSGTDGLDAAVAQAKKRVTDLKEMPELCRQFVEGGYDFCLAKRLEELAQAQADRRAAVGGARGIEGCRERASVVVTSQTSTSAEFSEFKRVEPKGSEQIEKSAVEAERSRDVSTDVGSDWGSDISCHDDQDGDGEVGVLKAFAPVPAGCGVGSGGGPGGSTGGGAKTKKGNVAFAPSAAGCGVGSGGGPGGVQLSGVGCGTTGRETAVWAQALDHRVCGVGSGGGPGSS